MINYVEEEDLNAIEILARGGANCGDEDFAMFLCPLCEQIYLMDHEFETIYLNANDLSLRSDGMPFTCIRCGVPTPKGDWLTAPEFRVPMTALLASDWAWIVTPAAMDRAELRRRTGKGMQPEN